MSKNAKMQIKEKVVDECKFYAIISNVYVQAQYIILTQSVVCLWD